MTHLTRSAFSIGATAALLAGCGGSQPSIGAPGAMPQSAALLPAHAVARRERALSYQVLYRFSSESHARGGANPDGGLLDVRGTLYGTTQAGGANVCSGLDGCGTVFRISPTGAKKKTLYRFGVGNPDDGASPTGDLIYLNGRLYGTTFFGGFCLRYVSGTVYEISTTGTEKVLTSFCASDSSGNPTGGVVNVNGTLYGTEGLSTYGDVYSVSTSGAYKVLHAFRGGYGDGASPDASLLNVKGTLYGTTLHGGSGRDGACYYNGGCGTVYSVTTSGVENVLYSFQGGADGWQPFSRLIDVNGTLYGTTEYGGGFGCRGQRFYWGCGTVYSITTSGTEKVLYRFTGGSDGANPNAGLVEIRGRLYGTTSAGGTAGRGTVFSADKSGKIGGEQVLHSFGGPPDGAEPYADLIEINGTLYGTTYDGGQSGCGSKGCGTVFALTP